MSASALFIFKPTGEFRDLKADLHRVWTARREGRYATLDLTRKLYPKAPQDDLDTWQVTIAYIFGPEDVEDFVAVINVLFRYAVEDIQYYREPVAYNDALPFSREQRKVIALADVKDYLPDMDDFGCYVITSEPSGKQGR